MVDKISKTLALIKSLLFLAGIFLLPQLAKCQSDSLTIYFLGEGPKGEKFKITTFHRQILKFKSRGGFRYSFKIPLPKEWINPGRDGAQIPFFLYRKGPFAIRYKRVEFEPFFNLTEYKLGKIYYAIYRDTRLKNQYAVDAVWQTRPATLTDYAGPSPKNLK